MLEIRGLSKSFDGVHALRDVDLRLAPGEVRGLVGTNGSGKSTLVKVLAGLHEPDPGGGEILVDGRLVDPRRDRGIEGFRFIHQDLALIDHLTVAENLRLGDDGEGRLLSRLRLRSESQAVRRLLRGYGLDFEPTALVGGLSIVERTMLAVARALGGGNDEARVLVLDEVTATLPPHETEVLFEHLDNLAGVSVIFVSHRIEEVLDFCESVTVLRDGQLVEDLRTEGLTADALVQLITGRKPGELYPSLPKPGRAPVLEVANLSGAGISDASFELHEGEIFGVASLNPTDGTRLLQLTYGDLRRAGGRIVLGGEEIPAQAGPKEAAERGIALVSDRMESGVPTFSVRENLTLNDLRPYAPRGLLKVGAERAYARSAIEAFGIRPPESEIQFSALSGGNQQKAVMAKAMRTDPSVLLLDDPTRGVDVGAKKVLYDAVRAAAAEGLAVLVTSSELDELCGLCHRVLVLRDGRPNGEIEQDALNPEHVLERCYLPLAKRS